LAAASPDPVLLVHGQPGGARDWDRVVAEIGQRARTIAVDRPGWDGHSQATDLAGNVDAAVAALDAHQAPRATIVGHSFGAAVAAWLAADHPERVGALVLVAPSANVASLDRVDHWLAAPVTGYVASAAALGGVGLALAARLTVRPIAHRLALDESYLETAGRLLRAPAAWRAFVTEQRVLINDLPVLESRLAQITAPTTIVMGSADRVVPSNSARRLAEQIPEAELVLVERSGHLLPVQQAARLAEITLLAGSHPARGRGSHQARGQSA
jgi:pimeloyl-ACP methyl ester carboxylesterase